MPSQAPRISSFRNELTDGHRTDGAFDLPPVPNKSSTSYKPSFGIDVAVSALERAEHIFLNVTSTLDKVPTIAERLSHIDGILPKGHQFNADESMDYIEMERLLISEMGDGAAQLVQSSACLLNTVKCFKTMQDSRCNTYEKGADLVLKQMEENEATVRRTEVDTEANNLSGDNRNDVDLEAPVLEETTGGVDAGADERGVNNVSADKSKDPVDAGKAHSPIVDVHVNKDLVDSGEAHSPTVDVPMNKDPVDGDVASADVMMPDVEQDVNVVGVGGKVADEDVAAASVLGCKSSSIGSDANDNVSDSEELPPENFLPGGLDYGEKMPGCLAQKMYCLKMMR